MAGFDLVGALEKDPLAAKTYKINHPEVTVIEKDIRDTNPDEFETLIDAPSIDLVAGCPPCQEFSRIKTKNGKRNSDSPEKYLINLFGEYVSHFKPKAVMLENVTGLANEECFKDFCNMLEDNGFFVNWEIFNAADFDVPQNRKRLILIACKLGPICFASKSKNQRTVRDAIGSLEGVTTSKDPLHNYKESRSERIKKMISLIPKNGGSRRDLPPEYHLDCHKNLIGFTDVYGRMAWDKCSPTITGGCINPSRGRFLHPIRNRAITLREASLLQGFPKNYHFCLDKGVYAAAQMIGNSFPPLLVKKHAAKLKKALD